mmetsp:Transcript_37707/g.90227  ORF Transcript_37707/g.90227 Transcript_37707/m.90227 type:complete len:212 (+) Transcript_37707:1606-2241(+)
MGTSARWLLPSTPPPPSGASDEPCGFRREPVREQRELSPSPLPLFALSPRTDLPAELFAEAADDFLDLLDLPLELIAADALDDFLPLLDDLTLAGAAAEFLFQLPLLPMPAAPDLYPSSFAESCVGASLPLLRAAAASASPGSRLRIRSACLPYRAGGSLVVSITVSLSARQHSLTVSIGGSIVANFRKLSKCLYLYLALLLYEYNRTVER